MTKEAQAHWNEIGRRIPVSGPVFAVRFPLGKIVATPGVLELVDPNGEIGGVTIPMLLRRHMSGDWGDIDAEDQTTNEKNLQIGERLMSVYRLGSNTVWVITERDRSVTTLLLPDEY